MNSKNITKIAKQIQDIIQEEVSNQRVDNDIEEKFTNLVYDLDHLIREAEELRVDFEEQKLSINTIEAEGYLRAMLTVKDIMKRCKS